MDFTTDIQTNLRRFFRLPVVGQQEHLLALIEHLFSLPPETWAGPWASLAQQRLVTAARYVVEEPIMRGDNNQLAADWVGCYWVVQLDLRGQIIATAVSTGGEASRVYDEHLESYAVVKAVCRLLTVKLGASGNLSPSKMQHALRRALPDPAHAFRGSYYHPGKQLLMGVSGAEVSWEQRQQWLPGLTPSGDVGRVNAIAGALDDEFARLVSLRLAGNRKPHTESSFLTELRSAH